MIIQKTNFISVVPGYILFGICYLLVSIKVPNVIRSTKYVYIYVHSLLVLRHTYFYTRVLSMSIYIFALFFIY